jgi:hypothetical protein
LRRIAVIATATVLVAASGAAYAATTGPFANSVSGVTKKRGTPTKPVSTGWTLNLTAQPSGNLRPPILLDVKTKIYGLKVDGKNFATCSFATIEAAHNDDVCPKKALVATGYIHALLGDSTDFTQTGAACDPGLDVWNSGQGKATYFFYTNNAYQCLGGALKTGATPPYAGTYKMVGKYFESDTPIPTAINYPVQGLVGSLEYEHLVFNTQTKGGHISTESVGCVKGKRPWAVTTTTTRPGSPTVVATVKGADPC